MDDGAGRRSHSGAPFSGASEIFCASPPSDEMACLKKYRVIRQAGGQSAVAPRNIYAGSSCYKDLNMLQFKGRDAEKY